MRRCVVILLVMLLFPVSAFALTATGNGETQSLAVRGALQAAIEQGVGIYISSSSVVEDMELVKEEMVSNTKGYVTSYSVLDSKQDADGLWTVKIEAEVSKELVQGHFEILETLMKLGGNPKVAVIADDSDMAAEPLTTEVFHPLMESVRSVFRDDFRFDVPTPEALRAKVSGRPTPENIQRIGSKIGIEFLVVVSVLKSPEGALSLVLRTSRISNGLELSVVRKELEAADLKKLKGRPYYTKIAEIAQAQVFPAAMEAAKSVVEVVSQETEGGKGALYQISLIGFKQPDALVAAMEAMSGFVSQKMVVQNASRVKMEYRSFLGPDELVGQMKDMFSQKNIDALFRQEGRVLKFKFNDPDGF